MKKSKNNLRQPPPLPATDHPTGVLKPGSIYRLFSLVDSPAPWFLHQQLFHSYDLAELEQELRRCEAKAKKQRRTIDTEQLREQIRLLELLNVPDDGVNFLVWEFEQKNAFQAELIYLLALHGIEEAFKSFDRKFHEYFWHLKRMASAGHKGALQSLATLAIEATEVVNRCAVKEPDTFAPTAAEHVYWPFLKSLHKQLDPIKPDAEETMLRKMQVGKNTQQRLSAASRYDPENAAVAVAQKLLNYVRSLRRLAGIIYPKKIPALLPEDTRARSFWERAAHLPEVAQTAKGDEEWWDFAKGCLLESYPAADPTSRAHWNTIAPTLLKLSGVRDRKRILKNLKRAFKKVLIKSPSPTVKLDPDFAKKLKKSHPDLYRRL